MLNTNTKKHADYVYQFIESENYNNRNPGAQIRGVILHHTATTDLMQTIDILTKKESQVSAHFLVDKNGDIYQLVETEHKAWHAGISNWRDLGQKNAVAPGNVSCNHTTVGIEIMNDGSNEAFTENQYDAVVKICNNLKLQYTAIEDCNIVGHSDIAPGRKIDPHVGFNWKLLFDRGIGIYSDKVVQKVESIWRHKDIAPGVKVLKDKLHKFGFHLNTGSEEYNLELDNVVKAFKRHHCPESYDDHNTLGWDTLAEVRLNDLLYNYYE